MIIDELIFDRTEADLEVPRLCKAQNIPFPNDNLRFSWDFRALNRTERAMEYLNQIFQELGYFRVMEFKTDWTNEEITPEQAKRYIENLKTLRTFLQMSGDTPPAPNTINGMSITRANDIERILYDINFLLEALQKNKIISGVPDSGQSRMWQYRYRIYNPMQDKTWEEIGSESTWEEIGLDKTWREVMGNAEN